MKHIVITGGNKGIGLEATKLFLDNGDKITIIARDFSAFNLKSDNINKIEFDLTNIDEIDSLTTKIDHCDILVNNAGVLIGKSLDSYSNEEKEKLLNLNLEAPIKLTQIFAKQMKKNSYGRIINLASIASHWAAAGDLWYGVSKAGLLSATKTFSNLLGSYNIAINAIAPGPVETEMILDLPRERLKEITNNTYLKRLATPKEVAKVIFWLAHEAPDYINGICIDINNGAYLR